MTQDSPHPAPPGPLDGIRVLEVASIVLGPLATQYLGDMGADVIKIEPPGGDLTRSLGPQRHRGMSAVFLNCNRNKRSVVLDLHRPEDQAVLHRMVADCDVLVHSIRTDAAQRMGLGWETIAPLNPRLVYCHLKGFSDHGEYAGRPAYDDVIQAMSGIAALQRIHAGAPRYLPTIFADKVAALHAAYAVMLGLFQRSRSGRGQEISVPMFEAITAFNAVEHLWGASFDPPIASTGYEAIVKSTRKPFSTRDGHLAFLPYTDTHWQRFFEAIGQPGLMADERFCTYPARQKHFKAVWGFVEETLATRTNAEWLAMFDQDMPIAPVATLDDLLIDPHLDGTGFWQFRDHPSEGRLRFAKCAIEMDDSPPALRRLPPLLGQHTEEVLAEFGIAR